MSFSQKFTFYCWHTHWAAWSAPAVWHSHPMSGSTPHTRHHSSFLNFVSFRAPVWTRGSGGKNAINAINLSLSIATRGDKSEDIVSLNSIAPSLDNFTWAIASQIITDNSIDIFSTLPTLQLMTGPIKYEAGWQTDSSEFEVAFQFIASCSISALMSLQVSQILHN